MKKTTIILLCVAAVVCMVLVGFTGYYIGSKSHKQDTTQVATNPLEETATTEVATADVEAIKAELREEVKEEVRQELYDEIYNQAMADVETSLNERLAELEAEQKAAEEEAAKVAEEAAAKEAEQPKQTTTKPSNGGGNSGTNTGNNNNNNNNNNGGGKTETPKVTPYIKVHDVSASMSGGTAAIEAALNSAVDASSGTVMCDASSITGLGTFPVYWTATDGATATSYITITE